ncbi:MAG: lysylphosphatidylglycerol synthase domain-containing protein [bacterium]
MKKTVSTMLKLLVSVLLFAFSLRKVEIKNLEDIFFSLNLFYFFFAFALMMAEQVLFSCMWFILLRTKKIEVTFLRIFYISLSSAFLGSFLPASVGPELAKIHQMHKDKHGTVDSISSLFLLRVISISSLFFRCSGRNYICRSIRTYRKQGAVYYSNRCLFLLFYYSVFLYC